VVDGGDAVGVARNYLGVGKTAWDQGNFNYDSVINLSDATIVQKNFKLSAVASGSPAHVSAAATLAGASVTGARDVKAEGTGLPIVKGTGVDDVTDGSVKKHRKDQRGSKIAPRKRGG